MQSKNCTELRESLTVTHDLINVERGAIAKLHRDMRFWLLLTLAMVPLGAIAIGISVRAAMEPDASDVLIYFHSLCIVANGTIFFTVRKEWRRWREWLGWRAWRLKVLRDAEDNLMGAAELVQAAQRREHQE